MELMDSIVTRNTFLTLPAGTHRMTTANSIYTFTLFADGSGLAECENRVTGEAGDPFRFVKLTFQLSPQEGLTAVFEAHCALSRDPHEYAAASRGNYRCMFTSPIHFLADINR